MKLLIYSHAFAPSVGGVETIVASLVRGLAKLSNTTDGSSVNATKLEVTVATQTPAGDFNDGSFPCRIVRRPGVLKLAYLILRADVVHIAGPALLPMFLSWYLRKPYVVEHHGYQAICPNGILLQQPQNIVCPGHFQAGHYGKCIQCESQDLSWFRAVAAVLLTFPRHFLAARAATNVPVSYHVAKRIALARTTVIYHGLESESFKPSQQPTAPATIKSEIIRFGYVGRFVPEKGIPILLEAAQTLRKQRDDFEIVLVGDGPQRPQLEELIRRAHAEDFIRITGFIQDEKLAAALNSLDVVVMPSIWEETAGLAAIEQMLRGRPVIVSDIGGLAEVVGDAALKFPAGNAEQLADQMSQLMQRDGQAADLGKIAQLHANSLFLADRMVADHLAAYHKLR
ncbi:MAG TPA: glycosyltransferase family 4 protein [Candidatus Acidoferrum sp.]